MLLNPECPNKSPVSGYLQLGLQQVSSEEVGEEMFFKSQVSLADTC